MSDTEIPGIENQDDASNGSNGSNGSKGGPDSEEKMSRGAHGRYGVEEESADKSTGEMFEMPKTPDEIERDAARDAEVKNTGEDLGSE
jgi:hypothetical protein